MLLGPLRESFRVTCIGVCCMLSWTISFFCQAKKETSTTRWSFFPSSTACRTAPPTSHWASRKISRRIFCVSTATRRCGGSVSSCGSWCGRKIGCRRIWTTPNRSSASKSRSLGEYCFLCSGCWTFHLRAFSVCAGTSRSFCASKNERLLLFETFRAILLCTGRQLQW